LNRRRPFLSGPLDPLRPNSRLPHPLPSAASVVAVRGQTKEGGGNERISDAGIFTPLTASCRPPTSFRGTITTIVLIGLFPQARSPGRGHGRASNPAGHRARGRCARRLRLRCGSQLEAAASRGHRKVPGGCRTSLSSLTAPEPVSFRHTLPHLRPDNSTPGRRVRVRVDFRGGAAA
jgi:hypothetical protein